MRYKHKVHPNKGHDDSVISYIGGKAALINNIVPIINYALEAYSLTEYMELCGGGARMLLSLEHSRLTRRVYNDIDESLYALFSCLTEPSLTYELMALLEEWGISEERYLWAKQVRLSSRLGDEGYDIVTAAACAFVVTRQSRAATMNSFNRSILTAERSRSYMRRVHNLYSFLPTMEGVEVTNKDVLEVLQENRNWGRTFIYIDPPYTNQEMIGDKHYRVNWSNEDHEKLVDLLLTHPAAIALSCYDNSLYSSRLVGWTKVYLKKLHISSSGVSGRFAEEFLWVNFKVSGSLLEHISEFDYSQE
ncbi:DNA adenine methylase [Paenibacillus sp. 1_12]|uniref:DNA adenine methylase n=1 Tax=Paenibacillus sp. 1_12 TaxID=1566278 RepID=UPI0008F361AE|nr:DNA adenine methylase [Paenibacillus sp. 1_12]SFL20884.1 DNA adenine methylase [Paenibacillus sp. 1_12]